MAGSIGSLFGRRPNPRVTARAIEAFWTWWAAHRDELAESIGDGTIQRWVDGMTSNVHGVDRGLAWEVAPGTSSRHRLTVTAGGDPELRRVARRWLRAAPPADAIWEYGDLRTASGLGHTLEIGGVQVQLEDLNVAASRRGTGLDVQVHHPVFGQLPEQLRAQISFLGLDSALGEEAVELWLGAIEAVPQRPEGARPLAELPALLAEVVAEASPEGEMGWTLLRGNGPKGPVLVSCLNRLSSVQAPDYDEHVAVTVPFSDATAEGWPGPGSLELLQALEDHLSRIVGGSGQVVAVESCAGVRTLHFYVDSTTPAADQLRVAAGGWQQGTVGVRSRPDPSWAAVAAFRS